MRSSARSGASGAAIVFVVALIAIVAGVGAYLTLAPSRSPTSGSSRSTASSSGASPPQVTIVPVTPLISPGETQNYTEIELSPGLSTTQENLTLKAYAPAGLTLVVGQGSVALDGSTQFVPIMMRAEPSMTRGNYSVTLAVASASFATENKTFKVQVVADLVVMQDVAFHPQNITVSKGTTVTWINLDSTIGCCDPGNHDVGFLTGANTTSPILKRYDSWSYTFGADGTFDYYCTIHPYMKGSVTVTG